MLTEKQRQMTLKFSEIHFKNSEHTPSVMCWGGISASGTGPLTLIPNDQRVNSEYYINILDEKLKLDMGT